jgi:TolB-like protein
VGGFVVGKHCDFPNKTKDRAFTLCHLRSCFLLLAMLQIYSLSSTAQQTDLKQVSSSLARDIASSGKHNISVADFTDLQGNVTELGRFIAEELSTNLVVEAKGFNVIERMQLKVILQEHQLNTTGLIDPATVRKLGQIAGVDALVTGILVPFSDSVRLTAKLLDTSTARVMAVSSAELPRTKAIDDLLSRGITSGTNPATSNTAREPSAQPAKLPTVQQNELLFVFKGCVRRDVRVVCTAAVTNQSSKSLGFSLLSGQSWTTLVEDTGNSHPSNGAGMSDGSRGTELMPDLPTNFVTTFPDVEPSATHATIIIAYSVNGAVLKVLFRNVSLMPK